MRQFKMGRCLMLVATDVAARGLDVKDIQTVVNFDMPRDVDTYVHRVGRTARAGAEGTALSLLVTTEHSDKYLRKLCRLVRKAKAFPEELVSVEAAANRAGRGGGGPGPYGGGGGRFRGGGRPRWRPGGGRRFRR